jgi:hypothetical protein
MDDIVTTVQLDAKTARLGLGFARGGQLIVERDPSTWERIPTWEIFTPDGRVLSAGPGPTLQIASASD